MAINKDHAATGDMLEATLEKFDFDYRPASYWPASRTRAQLLSRIKGRVRRDLAAAALEEGGVQALDAFLARESLPDEERRAWGLRHPMCMGGEYLPDLDAREVEIARLSLASTMSDQISIRARAGKNHIRIFVVDEYEMQYRPSHRRVQQPLSLRELIRLIDTTENTWSEKSFGMVWSLIHGVYDDSACMTPQEAGDFVTVDSAFYPELGAYYADRAARWVAQEQARFEHDDEDEVDASQ